MPIFKNSRLENFSGKQVLTNLLCRDKRREDTQDGFLSSLRFLCVEEECPQSSLNCAGDVAGYAFQVAVLDQLGEDFFERRDFGQVAETLD